MTGSFQRLELRLRLGAEDPPQAGDAHVVLVEILPQEGVGLELLEHDAVLLEDRPMSRLKTVLVEKAPDIALPSVDLAAAPMEDGGAPLADRRVDADDMEIPAWPAGRRIGNLQPQPVRAGVDEFRPVEVDVA